VTDQFLDTVYTTLEDSISENERRGWVYPTQTLGDTVTHAQGFATIHGFVKKGDDIVGEDYVDAGRLMIHVEGCSPNTAYSFVSTDNFTFTAYFRNQNGDTLILNDSQYSWNTLALNDTSGNLEPASGQGRVWQSRPDPPPAPLTRGGYMGYWVSCAAGYQEPTAKDTVFLHQDEIDKLRQEYIDSHKLRVPARSEFVFTMDAEYFSVDVLRSDDYTPFIFNQAFLDALDSTRTDYGYQMPMRKGFLSPNALYLSKGTDSSSSIYWENSPNSPHLFGLAADIDVNDEDHDGRRMDDWNNLAWVMRHNHIRPRNLIDLTMIHAAFDTTQDTSLISILVNPPRVSVGLDPHFNDFRIVRTVDIEARVDTSLRPYTGELTLYVDEVDSSGGHTHLNRPMNHHPADSVITADTLNTRSGTVTTSYRDTCKWGGQYVFSARYQYGNEQIRATDTLSIGIWNLTGDFRMQYSQIVALPDTSAWDTIRGEDGPYHWPANYIDRRWIRNMYNSINSFFWKCDSAYSDSEHVTIRMNDLSLPQGGRFDLMGQWDSSEAHVSHRWGYEADVSFTGFTRTHPYRQLLIDAFTETCGRPPLTNYDHLIHAHLCRQNYQWFPPE